MIEALDCGELETDGKLISLASVSHSDTNEVKNLELKLVPPNIRLVFLDDAEECPVIIITSLDEGQVLK